MPSTLDPHILIPERRMKPRPKTRICGVLLQELPAYIAPIHISPMLEPVPSLVIPEEPNVDGGRGFPTIVLASPVEAWPSPQLSTGYPIP